MTRFIGRWLVVATLASTGLGAAAHADTSKTKSNEEQHEKLTLDQLPPAVRATFEREANGGKVEELERESHYGKTIYEGEVTKGKHEMDLKVAEDGTVLSRH